MRRCAKAILVLLCVGYAGWASAACQVATTGLRFGVYDVFAKTDVRSTASITVTCDLVPPPTVRVAIGPSAHSGQCIARHMASGSSRLRYHLYRDPSLSEIWSDGPLTNTVMKNRPWVATIYGRIPAQQNVRAGVYSDTLVVTITW